MLTEQPGVLRGTPVVRAAGMLAGMTRTPPGPAATTRSLSSSNTRRRRIVAWAVAALALTAAGVSPAAAEPPASTTTSRSAGAQPAVDVPETGELPVCPAGEYVTNYSDSLFLAAVRPNYFDSGDATGEGLANGCAQQNWQHQPIGTTATYPHAVKAYTTPSTVSISAVPSTITFKIDGADMPGPYDVNNLDPCMPASSRAHGCAASRTGYSQVVYRLANGAGVFDGFWTVADQTTNPYFDFTRLGGTGACPTGLAGLDDPGNGVPCSYQVNFATGPNGAPVLTRAMQVAVLLITNSTLLTFNGFTGHAYSADVVVPILFTPGSSAKLTLSAAPTVVTHGASTTLHATLLSGTRAGTSVAFYAKPAGARAWNQVGTAVTNASGSANLPVRPARTTSYQARLVAAPVGAPITSNNVGVGVRQTVSVAATRVRHGTKLHLTGVVGPAGGTSSVNVQRLIGRVWRTVRPAPLSRTGAYAVTVTLPTGRTYWRIQVPASTSFVSTVSSSVIG